MNWVDLVILAVIIGLGIVGMVNGFILSIFRIASFLISAIVSARFYPLVAGILIKTPIYGNIHEWFLEMIKKQLPFANAQVKQVAADQVLNGLNLPGFLKDSILKQLPDPSALVGTAWIQETVSTALTMMVINIISVLVLFTLIRVILYFVRVILQKVARLPLFKQIDKFGGFAFGAVEGLLSLYIISAFLLIFQAAAQFKELFAAIDRSQIGSFIYHNNFIILWITANGSSFFKGML